MRRDAFLASIPFVLGILASGCSINGIGFASSEVTRADGAIVIATETFGAALQTGSTDAGLALGYTRTLLVTPDSDDAPRPGNHPFGIATSELPAVATIRRVIGLDLGLNRREVGLTLGYSETAVLAQIDRAASTAQSLVLTPDDYTKIALRFCQEPPCD